jgi:hypothetical protein
VLSRQPLVADRYRRLCASLLVKPLGLKEGLGTSLQMNPYLGIEISHVLAVMVVKTRGLSSIGGKN